MRLFIKLIMTTVFILLGTFDIVLILGEETYPMPVARFFEIKLIGILLAITLVFLYKVLTKKNLMFPLIGDDCSSIWAKDDPLNEDDDDY